MPGRTPWTRLARKALRGMKVAATSLNWIPLSSTFSHSVSALASGRLPCLGYATGTSTSWASRGDDWPLLRGHDGHTQSSFVFPKSIIVTARSEVVFWFVAHVLLFQFSIAVTVHCWLYTLTFFRACESTPLRTSCSCDVSWILSNFRFYHISIMMSTLLSSRSTHFSVCTTVWILRERDLFATT